MYPFGGISEKKKTTDGLKTKPTKRKRKKSPRRSVKAMPSVDNNKKIWEYMGKKKARMTGIEGNSETKDNTIIEEGNISIEDNKISEDNPLSTNLQEQSSSVKTSHRVNTKKTFA